MKRSMIVLLSGLGAVLIYIAAFVVFISTVF
jgi:hypothetical protein